METERLPEEIEWHFKRFVERAQEMLDRHVEEAGGPPGREALIEVDKGRVYWKLIFADRWLFQDYTHRSVWCFIRRKDGAVFSAASWRAPQTKTKTPIKGYIWEDEHEFYPYARP